MGSRVRSALVTLPRGNILTHTCSHSLLCVKEPNQSWAGSQPSVMSLAFQGGKAVGKQMVCRPIEVGIGSQGLDIPAALETPHRTGCLS